LICYICFVNVELLLMQTVVAHPLATGRLEGLTEVRKKQLSPASFFFTAISNQLHQLFFLVLLDMLRFVSVERSN